MTNNGFFIVFRLVVVLGTLLLTARGFLDAMQPYETTSEKKDKKVTKTVRPARKFIAIFFILTAFSAPELPGLFGPWSIPVWFFALPCLFVFGLVFFDNPLTPLNEDAKDLIRPVSSLGYTFIALLFTTIFFRVITGNVGELLNLPWLIPAIGLAAPVVTSQIVAGIVGFLKIVSVDAFRGIVKSIKNRDKEAEKNEREEAT